MLKEIGLLEKALDVTLMAISLNPEQAVAHLNYGVILQEMGQLDQALDATNKAIALNPGIADMHMNLALILQECGQLDQALAAVLKAIDLDPYHANSYTLLGRLHEVNGDLSKARNFFTRSLQINPQQGWAYYETSKNLASLNEATIILDLIRAMPKVTLSYRDSMFLAFARSNCYHMHKDFFNSAKCLVEANKIKKRLHPSDKNHYISSAKRLLLSTDHETTINSSLGQGRVFIVGIPRCGSSLVQTVLTTNPLAVDLGENSAMSKAISKLIVGRQKLTSRTLEDLYLDHLNIPIPASGITLDKQLYNYISSGHIACNMPAAKIIHCRRNPLDNILSMFRANLAAGNNYSSSLEDSAEVLISQEQLMMHFKDLFPSAIYTLSYETLVNDPDHEIRRLVAWLEWDWNDDYLEPHLTTRSINTASVIQARQPISNKSVGGWSKYAEMLEPARRVLIESGLFDNEILFPCI